jgi:hypothetical protein
MTVVALAKTEYDVLNTVTLKKMATVPVIAEACGLDVSEAEAIIERLVGRELVAAASAAALPTDAAEPALADSAARFYVGVREDPLVAGLAERFDVVNRHFLTTISSWQLVDAAGRKIANTHTDAAYDDKVIGRLARLVDQLAPLLSALAGHDGRFTRYQDRFTAAVTAIDQGQHDLVSSPTADSIHNIWFEFHEDLLRTLGRSRVE